MSNVNIPKFIHAPFVDLKTGEMHPAWEGVMTQLMTQLANTLSNEGVKIPTQPTATITKLNTMQSLGGIIYDSETNQFKGNVNGTYKVFTLT